MGISPSDSSIRQSDVIGPIWPLKGHIHLASKTVHLQRHPLFTVMKNFFGNLFGLFSTPWWVKITTAEPHCIYYFGPFDSETEAIQAKPGYIEDLQQEGAQQIQTSFQHSSEPEELTIELETSLQSSVMLPA